MGMPKYGFKEISQPFDHNLFPFRRYFRFSPIDPDDQSLPTELKQKFIPFLYNRPCLNRKEMLRPTSNGISRPNRGGGQTPSGLRGLSSPTPTDDSLDDILRELKTRLQGLQQH
jgi:hypothetical protein